jgi:hypothetical protein
MIGYSAGSRSKPQFDWVKNLLHKIPQDQVERLNFEASSAFAIFWNMLKTHAPASVMEDTDKFFTGIGIHRMDGNQRLPGSKGRYVIEIDGVPVEFYDVELAPPCGVFGVNYARSTHYEKQPHKYAMSWTTGRTLGRDDGGHFYVSQYGIRVQGAPNTLVIWKPGHKHGTSLQKLSPTDRAPRFTQTGMSIVTSGRIRKIWEKYQATGVAKPEDYLPEEFDE